MQQLVKETVSNYNEFINKITDRVKEMMGEEFSVRICKVIKNNSLELDSLVILKKGKNFAPNIYLLPYFEAFMRGESVNNLAKKICDIIKNNMISAVNEKFSYSYEDIKQFIIYRLVSFEKNKKLLDKIPYIKFLDMAITFHCLVREDEDGIGTIRITNEHMQMWEVSQQDIYVLAVNNTEKLFPQSIRNMNEVIMGMLQEECSCSIDEEFSDKLANNFISNQNAANDHRMYILSNQKGINGATCLLYENVLHKFAEQIQSDFFILPSSIHEVILVPYDKTLAKEILIDMVREVNQTQVARDEVLSDTVYFYSRKNNAIML